jgi:hypothetical protein
MEMPIPAPVFFDCSALPYWRRVTKRKTSGGATCVLKRCLVSRLPRHAARDAADGLTVRGDSSVNDASGRARAAARPTFVRVRAQVVPQSSVGVAPCVCMVIVPFNSEETIVGRASKKTSPPAVKLPLPEALEKWPVPPVISNTRWSFR